MWLKRQLEACEGNEKRYVRTYSHRCYLSSAGFSPLMVPFHFSSRMLRRASERCARVVFFPFPSRERTVECKTHCRVGAGGEKGRGRNGRGGKGREGGGTRSYYGNTHARTRVSRFLWRAGSLRAARWRTVVCSVIALRGPLVPQMAEETVPRGYR